MSWTFLFLCSNTSAFYGMILLEEKDRKFKGNAVVK